MNWFDVDRNGLKKLVAGKPKSFVLAELLQNAWDEEGVSLVTVHTERIPGTRDLRLVVEDDAPDGFKNLSHAFTLFAESAKKGDATKRGRFNLGEKLCLALCRSARIETTTGTIWFDDEGRHRSSKKRERGTRFEAAIPMTQAEEQEFLAFAQRLLPPADRPTQVNGAQLPYREPQSSIESVLPTVVSDAEGVLRRTERTTRIEVIKPAAGETGWIYELGIPVVETGDAYSLNVMQKVPLTLERDNVPPTYLKRLRTLTLNATYTQLDGEQANQSWVRDALGAKDVVPEAVSKVLKERYGEKVVAFDPSDREANARATAAGFTVLHGGALSGAEWANVRAAGAAAPAGQVFPTHNVGEGELKLYEQADWTPGMHALAAWSQKLAQELLGVDIRVQYSCEVAVDYRARYGHRCLEYNLAKLGKRWADEGPTERVVSLLIHELAHEIESNHLDDNYYRALTDLGARLALATAQNPSLVSLAQWSANARAQAAAGLRRASA